MLKNDGIVDLDTFRRIHDGQRYLDMLVENGGRLQVDLPLGIGKSSAIDQIVEKAVESGRYGLVVVLAPTLRVLEERPWLHKPPAGVYVTYFKRRPSSMCGAEKNSLWGPMEIRGLGALGKEKICRNCKHYRNCFWPRQYSSSLEDIDVVFATQSHLERAPDFIDQLQRRAGGSRVLVLIDEGSFLSAPFARLIRKREIEITLEVLQGLIRTSTAKINKKYFYYIETLEKAKTEDLRRPEWILPHMSAAQSYAIQEYGWDAFGDEFYNIGSMLDQFGRSPIDSRAKTKTGDIRFAAPPAIGQDMIIFSGTTNPELMTHRLGVNFPSPFSGLRFEHPGTRIYNLRSRMGMARYLRKNAPQIFDLFGDFLIKRIREGKRFVLLAKKQFVGLCIEEIQRRLDDANIDRLVINANSKEFNNQDHRQTPIIHFGMIGVNDFEEYDGLIALTGFYVNEAVVDKLLQDILAEDFHLPIKIRTEGIPPRRVAGVTQNKHRIYDLHRLAQLALDDREMSTVMQAAGRVRFFTKPREIFLFQCADLPKVTPNAEFTTLAEAREFFGLQTRRQKQAGSTFKNVQGCRERGITQVETATHLKISLRTVKRYWKG